MYIVPKKDLFWYFWQVELCNAVWSSVYCDFESMSLSSWQILSLFVASGSALSRSDWPSLMQRLRREVVDLHSGEFCVDVSTYGDIKFEGQPREKCDTTFEKKCETKSEQVRYLLTFKD